MRSLTCLLLVAFFLMSSLIGAQDTLYLYKSGSVVLKHSVYDLDSVIFYRMTSAVNHKGVSDIDGNDYDTVQIGSQTWLGKISELNITVTGSLFQLLVVSLYGINWILVPIVIMETCREIALFMGNYIIISR